MSGFIRLGLAVVSLAVIGQAASAEPLPDWSYRNPFNETAFPVGSSGGLSFPNGVFQTGGSGDIVASRVAEFSIAPSTAPDAVTSLPYQFTLELRDNASRETGRVAFGGVLSGTIWRTGAALQNQFTGPLSQAVDLGDNHYAVTLTGFTAPGGFGDAAAGSITARVSVVSAVPQVPSVPVVVPGDPAPTPEPATLLLALVGLPLLVRRRRKVG